ncbi:uncharacterized protein BXZ73DRAFT_99619 [Epithele typhae]|uniref:uncharacterized protein n=1 Tax=Epithele typhae TaxID=378194 RepID=UPI002007DB25|nr:uncharacterized protein BXZ73DRAFT_99619 [Epithele typhae]KAH9939414.1 hypothetical protein BXZ73DRAFT_99619 [Epithele typhae]
MTSSPSAITLSVRPTIHLSGSFLEGEVLLDYRKLQEEDIQEVHLKLRGALAVHIQRGKRRWCSIQSLIQANVSLWTHGSAYPPPDTHVLPLPFRLLLPQNLPPSFIFEPGGSSAHIEYAIVVVRVRPGTFKSNRRINAPLVVLPPDPVGARIRMGADMGWKRTAVEERIRRRLWGERSRVQVELALPEIPVFPVFADLPELSLTLRRLTRVHARDELSVFRDEETTTHEDTVMVVLGRPRTDVETELPEKEWVAQPPAEGEGEGGEEHGVWVQRARFQATMRLDVTPTFANEFVQCEYLLHLRVPFDGMSNDVKLDVPIIISSGIDFPVLRVPPTSSSPLSSSAPAPAMAQPMLGLPSSYWDPSDRSARQGLLNILRDELEAKGLATMLAGVGPNNGSGNEGLGDGHLNV